MDRRHFLTRAGGALGAGVLSGMGAACQVDPVGNQAHILQHAGGGGNGEFRAAWIATVYNLDWPSQRGGNANLMRQQLTHIIERLSQANLNTIIFQIRPACDALYRSRLEPWSPWLTGRMGQDPGFDPLAHALEEAHRRGMELHAWLNPFRALADERFAPTADHVTRRHPHWIRRMGKHIWLDPGLPEVQDHSLAVVADVCQRYPVDGIHFDDYFYPYPIPGHRFPDDASFQASGTRNRLEWRRENVNRFVRRCYQTVHQIKPQVKFGISPFGIWRPNVPEGIEAGLDAFDDLAADARLWLRQGWVDYLAPQLYWRDGGPQSFSALLHWWQSENVRGRHLWPGLDSTSDRGHSLAEIRKQILFSRGIRGIPVPGQIFWAARDIVSNRLGLADLLRNELYSQPAAVPHCPWLG